MEKILKKICDMAHRNSSESLSQQNYRGRSPLNLMSRRYGNGLILQKFDPVENLL